jgi:beta-lactamase regulating signal transducer with metallopeptidase domain
MEKLIKRYKKIVNQLVKKSFPELNNERIKIILFSNFKNSAAAVDLMYYKIILVNSKKRYTDSALKGLFAHELSHFSIITNMNFFDKLSYFLFWTFSKKIKSDFERKADILAIEKGYAKDLIALKNEAFKGKNKTHLERIYKKGYMSIKEIKLYIENGRKKVHYRN